VLVKLLVREPDSSFYGRHVWAIPWRPCRADRIRADKM
jgi:hypothetical protein